ncbi:MAG TPA: S41 family peptidase [Chryseolinea sp.]|nr:S41 family peptidase [Chryseolinea sp.]
MRQYLVAFLLSFVVASTTSGQEYSNKEGNAAVASIVSLIRAKYVFPSKGDQIADKYNKAWKSGQFKDIRDWKTFAERSTQILQEVIEDGHMYVNFDPGTSATLKAPVQDSETQTEDQFFHGADARQRNFGFRKVEVLEGNIGYILLSEINISVKSLSVLHSTMNFIANTDTLIIDLRHNHGGGSEIGAVLETYFFSKPTSFLEFRSRDGKTEISKTVNWLTDQRYLKPLFIITDRGTASAAEAFAFSLQATRRAKIVGERSAGAAHMNSWYFINNEIFLSVSTAAPTLPGTESNWERKGVQPDIAIDSTSDLNSILARIRR